MDERDPITRIAMALESIAESMEKLANPLLLVKEPFVQE